MAVAGLLSVALVPAVRGGVAGAAGGPTVSVSATTNIIDGQVVTVTVRTTDDAPVSRALASLCRGGVDYQESAPGAHLPNQDFAADGPNCPGPSHPISSSADTSVTDTNTSTNAKSADGESFLFRLGSGVQTWTDAISGNQVSLTCDATSPCALVVELQYSPAPGEASKFKPFAVPISYGLQDPIAGCGGAATGALSASGPDRFLDAWIAWTLVACALPGAHGAPTRTSFAGEGEAVKAFAAGTADLAYTAGGYNTDIDLLRDAELPEGGARKAVAVPVALNATVLAVGGGVRVDESHKVPYKDLKLTAAEVATMISGGANGVGQPTPASTESSPRTYKDDIEARNPELAQTGLFDNAAGFAVGALAGPESSSWYATRWLKTLAPDAWKVPNLALFGSDQGKARGIDSWLARAEPSFEAAIKLLSGRPDLRKGLIGPSTSTAGGVWVLTDLETADALDLTPVQIPNADGAFVTPTAASLAAALPSMKADSQGLLISDPTVAAAQGGVTPYPMTMVEYALVPAEPLLAVDCSPRTASQKLMTDWLTYVTGDGQSKLPEGMIPLPDALKTAAAAQIKKVGASPVTGSCAKTASDAENGSDLAAPAGVTDSPAVEEIAAPVVSSAAALDAMLSVTPIPPAAVAPLLTSLLGVSQPTQSGSAEVVAPAPDTLPALVKELAAIPPYVVARTPTWIVTVLALMAIVGLLTLALRVTSRPS